MIIFSHVYLHCGFIVPIALRIMEGILLLKYYGGAVFDAAGQGRFASNEAPEGNRHDAAGAGGVSLHVADGSRLAAAIGRRGRAAVALGRRHALGAVVATVGKDADLAGVVIQALVLELADVRLGGAGVPGAAALHREFQLGVHPGHGADVYGFLRTPSLIAVVENELGQVHPVGKGRGRTIDRRGAEGEVAVQAPALRRHIGNRAARCQFEPALQGMDDMGDEGDVGDILNTAGRGAQGEVDLHRCVGRVFQFQDRGLAHDETCRLVVCVVCGCRRGGSAWVRRGEGRGCERGLLGWVLWHRGYIGVDPIYPAQYGLAYCSLRILRVLI